MKHRTFKQEVLVLSADKARNALAFLFVVCFKLFKVAFSTRAREFQYIFLSLDLSLIFVLKITTTNFLKPILDIQDS